MTLLQLKDSVLKKQPIESLQTPEDIAASIDTYVKIQKQIKELERQALEQKSSIASYSREVLACRISQNEKGSFRLQGNEEAITFIMQDSGSGIGKKEYNEFLAAWGEEIAKATLETDIASIKFDPETLRDNLSLVLKAIGTLPPEIQKNLFKPTVKKVKRGITEILPQLVTENEVGKLLSDLRYTTKIQSK